MLLISSKIELCNDGKCYRVRMGEEWHKKHIFTNDYLKKDELIRDLSTISFILLVSLSVLVLWRPQLLILEPKDGWTVGIAILAVAVSTILTITNFRFKNKQLQTSSLFKVFELLSSPEIRDSRKAIHTKYREFKKDQKKIFSGTDAEKDADIVLSSFDQVSATVLNRLLDKDLFFDTYGEMIVRDWKTLKDEIEMRQDKNKKTLRHFTTLKNQFEYMLKREKNYEDSDTEPY